MPVLMFVMQSAKMRLIQINEVIKKELKSLISSKMSRIDCLYRWCVCERSYIHTHPSIQYVVFKPLYDQKWTKCQGWVDAER